MSGGQTIRQRANWRLALVTSGVILLLGGSMHPDSGEARGTRAELAAMMEDDNWQLSHVFIVVSTILLTIGLFGAIKANAWPTIAERTQRIAAIALTLYSVETVFHLFSYVDSDELVAGGGAPVAFTHIGLGLALYPLSGLAIANLAKQQIRVWSLPARVFAAAGIGGGVLHAISLPLTVAFDDVETSPIFAFAGILLAIWSIAAGLTGFRSYPSTDAAATSALNPPTARSSLSSGASG